MSVTSKAIRREMRHYVLVVCDAICILHTCFLNIRLERRSKFLVTRPRRLHRHHMCHGVVCFDGIVEDVMQNSRAKRMARQVQWFVLATKVFQRTEDALPDGL